MCRAVAILNNEIFFVNLFTTNTIFGHHFIPGCSAERSLRGALRQSQHDRRAREILQTTSQSAVPLTKPLFNNRNDNRRRYIQSSDLRCVCFSTDIFLAPARSRLSKRRPLGFSPPHLRVYLLRHTHRPVSHSNRQFLLRLHHYGRDTEPADRHEQFRRNAT